MSIKKEKHNTKFECRLCLEYQENCFPLFDDDSEVITLLETITCLKFEEDDGLPSTCCANCLQDVYNIYNLKIRVVNSDKILRERLKKQSLKSPTKRKILILGRNISSNTKSNVSLKKDPLHCEEDIKQGKAKASHKDAIIFQAEDFEFEQPEEDPLQNIGEVKETIYINEKPISKQTKTRKIANVRSTPRAKKRKTEENDAEIEKKDDVLTDISKEVAAEKGETSSEAKQEIKVNIIDKAKDKEAKTEIEEYFVDNTDLIKILEDSDSEIKPPEENDGLQEGENKIDYEHSEMNDSELDTEEDTQSETSIQTQNGSTSKKPYHIGGKREKREYEIVDPSYSVNLDEYVDEWKCFDCGSSFQRRVTYLQHMMKHRGETECKVCHMMVRPRAYTKHQDIHQSGEVNCKICNSVCKNIESLRSHIYYMHKCTAEKYKCEDCNKFYRFKYSYEFHRRKRHGEGPQKTHICEKCSKGFLSYTELKYHISQVHDKTFSCICKYCGKQLSNSYALTCHIRKHTNECPYECHICSMKFRQGVSLRRHLVSKHNQSPKQSPKSPS